MTVTTQEIPEGFIILINGELDVAATRSLDSAIKRAIATQQPCIWVDCAGLLNISTTTLRLILSYMSTFDARGISLVLYHVEPLIQKRLEDSGLADLLTIVPSIKEAYLLSKHHH